MIKMHTNIVKGSWDAQKSKLKQKFVSLLDNDLIFKEGQQEELFKKLQIKLGKTKEELQLILSTL